MSNANFKQRLIAASSKVLLGKKFTAKSEEKFIVNAQDEIKAELISGFNDCSVLLEVEDGTVRVLGDLDRGPRNAFAVYYKIAGTGKDRGLVYLQSNNVADA